jgi:primase-polymerase (primpol)-like protein
MWCRKPMTDEFIKENSTQKFYGEHFDYQVGIMIEQRKMRLTDVQDEANSIIRDRNYKIYFDENRHKLFLFNDNP